MHCGGKLIAQALSPVQVQSNPAQSDTSHALIANLEIAVSEVRLE